MKQFVLLWLITMCFSLSLKAQDDNDNDCEKIQNKKASRIYNRAFNEYKKKQYQNVTGLLKEAIDIESEYVDAYYLLGLMNYRRAVMEQNNSGNMQNLNCVKLAKKYLCKVVELCPQYNPYTFFYLGQIYYGANQFDSTYYCFSEFMKDSSKIKSKKDYNTAKAIVRYAKSYVDIKSKSVLFKPYPVKGLSTKLDEYLAIISFDNEIALFTRKDSVPPRKGAFVSDSPVFKEKFIISRLSDGEYDKGKLMPDPFNKNDNEGGATLSIDNKLLIYTISKMIGNYLNTDLYYSEYNNEKWSSIKSMGPKINATDSWESQPSISADGKDLYFASNRKGGYGGIDIYKVSKNEDDEWGMPVNMGTSINTAGDEKSPFIHPDNKTLYFSSTGHPGLGGYDIFFCKKNNDSSWTIPKNIGYPINSKDDDFGFFVSTDGKKGFFCTNRKELDGMGGWDIYSFDLYAEARPEKVLLVKGNVKDEVTGEPVRAKVELKNIATKQITEIPVDTTTGKYIAIVLFRNDYIISVKKEDYIYESKYIAREDTVSSASINVDMEIQSLEVGKAYKLNDIKFATNSSELIEKSKALLDEFIEFLISNPDFKVAIHGHTDDVDDAEYNLKLSENRAKSVYEYLINNNIEESRLSYRGFGETKPIESNATPEGRAKNRRTEFVIIEK